MLALLESKESSQGHFEGFLIVMKVKVRLMGTEKEVSRLRLHLLKKHPQMILGKPVEGNTPLDKAWAVKRKWFVYGDYEFNKIRRRRGE